MIGELTQYCSVRATPAIVGRKEILGLVNEALNKESKKPTVFYITAGGGSGKTRLLEAVLKRVNTELDEGGWGSTEVSGAVELVDLYHLHTHSEEGLINNIVEVLDPENESFKNYRRELQRLTQFKHDLSEVLREVTSQRQKVLVTFIEDFCEYSSKKKKVVLALDTAENLVYETDRVQQALGLDGEPIGVAGWLTRTFLENIGNQAIILIAGRPETPQLEEELHQLENSDQIELIEYSLPVFDEEESLGYFEAVIASAMEEDPSTAKRIAGIPEETRRVMHYLVGGEPLLLSMMIDYLSVTYEVLPEVRMGLGEAKTIAEDYELFIDVKERLQKAIVKGLMGARRPFDEIIRVLSWMPKGTGAESLAWMLKRAKPTEQQIEEADEMINSLRLPKNRLSFIKIRPLDNLIFLQDEVYAMFAESRRDIAPKQVDREYRLILDFYEYKIETLMNRIEGMQREVLEKTYPEIMGRDLAQLKLIALVKDRDELRRARLRLQNYQVEQVYYTLQVNPIEGFEIYYEYGEEAFRSNESTLWLQLRDEMLKFARPYREKIESIEGLRLSDIDSDIGIRWIKNNMSQGKYEIALIQIKDFRKQCPDLLPEVSFQNIDLKIWEAWNQIYSTKELEKVEKNLKILLDEVRVLPDLGEFIESRKVLLNASTITNLGYLYRTQGRFHDAIKRYLEVLPLWRRLKIETETANTLNNLAWVSAEVGEFQAAIQHCLDGLELREKMGKRYTLALSLNTLGLIETRNDQPERARFRCEQALSIFRDLEQPRGVGLACHALAEALRRMTNIPRLLAPDAMVKSLERAKDLAEEAVFIFGSVIEEPLRLAEANIELGCTCREWARKMPDDNPQRILLIEDGVKALRDAADVAGDTYIYRKIDALVSLAWLYYYIGDTEKAVDVLTKEVRRMIDDNYLYTTEHSVNIHELTGTVPWIWVQLGKADMLLGVIHFDDYDQSNRKDEKVDAKKHLESAAHDWALALAYDALFGDDYRDMNRGLEVLYEKISGLNDDEMKWVLDSIDKTYIEYHIDEKEQLLARYIYNRFGYRLERDILIEER